MTFEITENKETRGRIISTSIKFYLITQEAESLNIFKTSKVYNTSDFRKAADTKGRSEP